MLGNELRDRVDAFSSVVGNLQPILAQVPTFINVEADLKEICKPLPPAPITADEIWELFARSHLLKAKGVEFSEVETGIWTLKHKGISYKTTFNPTLFEEKPSLRLTTWGGSSFKELLQHVC